MKIRNGFVSNSSSSSFILYGSYVDDLTEEQKEKFNEHDFLTFQQDDEEGAVIGIYPHQIDENLPLILTKEMIYDELKKDFPEIRVKKISFCFGTYFD